VTRSYMCHESFKHVEHSDVQLIHMRDMTHDFFFLRVHNLSNTCVGDMVCCSVLQCVAARCSVAVMHTRECVVL